MPISYMLDSARQRLLTTVSGPIVFEDIRDHLETLRKEQNLGYAELIDARTATTSMLSSADILRLADLARPAVGQRACGPRAVVVNIEVAFGMVRMLGILLTEHSNLEVFRGLDEAERWLAGFRPVEGA
jgi:hypothetical protein